jgi:uncharacterized membrane protein (UPF0127 family)
MGWLKKPQNFWLSIAAAILISAGLGLIVIVGLYAPAPALPTATVKINDRMIKAEVTTKPAAMYRGLSGRHSLCADCGLLFNFSDRAARQFVMRDMEFPLDIIFIGGGRIIKIAANLPPAGTPPEIIYNSDGPADQVLEVNAGYAAASGIKIGDIVSVAQ